MQKAIRIICCLCGALVGYGITSFTTRPEVLGDAWSMTLGQKIIWIGTGTAFFAFIFDFLSGAFRKRGEIVINSVDSRLNKVPATEIAAGSIGLIVGFVIAFLISRITSEIELLKVMNLDIVIAIALYLVLGLLGVTVARRLYVDVCRPLIANLANREPTAKSKGILCDS